MFNLHFLDFNNYYNRQNKLPNEQYLDVFSSFIIDSSLNRNFNSFDGIQAKIEARIQPAKTYNALGIITKEEVKIPNYVIVCDTDRPNEIVSRWFVIECDFQGSEMYQLTLVRDIIAENYQTILTSPCYIEKGWVPNTDSAIFNSEGVLVNQIKKNETILYDYTKVPWIVGYLDSKYEAEGPITGSFSPAAADMNYATIDEVPFAHLTSIGNERYPQYFITGNSLEDDFYYTISVDARDQATPSKTYIFTIYQDPTKNTYEERAVSGEGLVFTCQISNSAETILNRYSERWSNLAVLFAQGGYSSSTNLGNTQQREELTGLNSKNIFIEDTGKLYSVESSLKEIITDTGKFAILNNSAMSQYFTYSLASADLIIGTYDIDNGLKYPTTNQMASLGFYAGPYAEYNFNLIEQAQEQFSIPISTTRKKLADAPYDMFAIPYGDFIFIKDNEPIKVNSLDSLSVASLLGKELDANLYDIQLLPYSPITALKKDNAGRFLLNDLTESGDYSLITKGGVNSNIIFWSAKSNFTFNISQTIEVEDYKITNECDMWRLCSPNYNGVFEFNAAKNGGVQFFNVDCSYKPISPYIHINPAFGRLYGADYNDARGLICGGDFSLPIIKDAWISYELQNKNYEKTFQRGLDNMEVQHDVARIQEKVGVAAGTIQGSASGAMTGAMIGGGWGAAIGGIVGGAASLGGGLADIALNEKLRNEALDYTRDMFNYNLDNIKALPNSLAKVSAFTFNNKIVPFLEYYSCSDEEKEAIRDKIKYNGMTIKRIGQIKDYLKEGEETYIKAQLIRWEGKSEDFHFINHLSNELNKGVFTE